MPVVYNTPPGQKRLLTPFLPFNGDGRRDLLVGAFQPGAGGSSRLGLALGNGAGFDDPVILSFDHAQPFIGDVTGDSLLDIVTVQDRFSNFEGIFDGVGIQVFAGDGPGGFEAGPFQALGGRGATPQGLRDMNRDGQLDLVFSVTPWHRPESNLTDHEGLWVWQGNGAGGFTPGTASPTPLPTSERPTSVDLVDLDGNGYLDALLGSDQAAHLRLMVNEGFGNLYAASQPTVRTGISLNTSLHGEASVVSADFNADGRSDLAAISTSGGLDIVLARSDGGHEHTASLDLPIGNASWLRVGDLNNDEVADLVVGDGKSAAVLLGIGNGEFSLASGWPVSPLEVADGLFRAELVDVNLDGQLDLVASLYKNFVSNSGVTSSGGTGYGVFFGDGRGGLHFNRNTLIPTDIFSLRDTPFLVHDFDGDLQIDLLASTPNGLRLFQGNGQGVFTPTDQVSSCVDDDPFYPGSVCYAPESMALMDVNQDGQQDLVIHVDVDWFCCPEPLSEIQLLLGYGKGRFILDTVSQIVERIDRLLALDIDGDGIHDLMLRREKDSVILRGEAGGTFVESPLEGSGLLVVSESLSTDAQSWTNVGNVEVTASLATPHYAGPDTVPANRQLFVATSDTNTTVTLTRASAMVADAMSDADGNWRLVPDARLPRGFYTLTLVAHDGKGRVSQPESFNVLIGAPGGVWQNSRNRLDVNDDGFVTPIDALIVINYLNANVGKALLPKSASPPPFLDVSGDDFSTPVDALIVINHLNVLQGGEGESDKTTRIPFAPPFRATTMKRPSQHDTAGVTDDCDQIVEDERIDTVLQGPPEDDEWTSLRTSYIGDEIAAGDELEDLLGVIASDKLKNQTL